MSFSFSVTGLDEAIANLKGLADIKDDAVAFLDQKGSEILDIAGANVPRLTGELASSGYKVLDPENLTVEVGFDSPHAVFVELGTGRRGAASSTDPAVEGYEHGGKPGMDAQPFLWPATEQVVQSMLEDVGKLVTENPNVSE